jgi:hypothetical protein
MFEKHGQTGHPLYVSWRAMRSRCLSPTDWNWQNYGARGITICREWSSFPRFMKWALKNGWSSGLTIDRVDVNGHYEPANCRWTDAAGQAENKRPAKVAVNAVLVQHEGVTLNLRQWAAKTGIGYTTLMKRLQAGKTGADLFAAIVQRKSHPKVRALKQASSPQPTTLPSSGQT